MPRGEKNRASRAYWSGNKTSCAHACKIRNGALSNGQQLLTWVNLTLWSLWRWVIVELRAVISISFVLKWRWALKAVFEISLLQDWRLNEERKKNTKMALSLPHTFAFGCLPRRFWATIWVLLITKALKEEAAAWALKIAFSALGWGYTAFA